MSCKDFSMSMFRVHEHDPIHSSDANQIEVASVHHKVYTIPYILLL